MDFVGSVDEVAVWKEKLPFSLIQRLSTGLSPIESMPDTDKDGFLDEWETQYASNLTSLDGTKFSDAAFITCFAIEVLPVYIR